MCMRRDWPGLPLKSMIVVLMIVRIRNISILLITVLIRKTQILYLVITKMKIIMVASGV